MQPWDPWESPWHFFDFAPPWRERLGRGFGPRYGPRTASALDAEWERWNASRAGGGLWDDEEDPPRTGAAVRPSVRFSRPDAVILGRWARARAERLPLMEVAVWLELYEAGSSLRQAAARLVLNNKAWCGLIVYYLGGSMRRGVLLPGGRNIRLLVGASISPIPFEGWCLGPPVQRPSRAPGYTGPGGWLLYDKLQKDG